MVEGRQFWQNWRLMQIQSHSPEAASAAAAMPTTPASPAVPPEPAAEPDAASPATQEFGGPSGPEPTRFGDWERKGRCIDF